LPGQGDWKNLISDSAGHRRSAEKTIREARTSPQEGKVEGKQAGLLKGGLPPNPGTRAPSHERIPEIRRGLFHLNGTKVAGVYYSEVAKS
jgi:hypothetical protein